MTLWGNNATKLVYAEGRVLAIKGARVSDYGGKSLNAGDEHSQVFLDPVGDLRCEKLYKWYASASPEQLKNTNSITAVRETVDASSGT